MFARTRVTSWRVIIAVVVANCTICAAATWAAPVRHAITVLTRQTGWLLSPYLSLCGVETLLLVGGLMILVGRLRPSDLGLTRRGIAPGLAFFLLLWGGVQLVLGGDRLVAGEPIRLHAAWADDPARALGAVIGSVAGVALYEELVFRGFLLAQFCRKLATPIARRTATRALALVGSQVLFALGHVPHHLRGGMPAAEYPEMLVLMFAYGTLFALVYLRSGNLLYAVAVHGLINPPAALVADDALAAGTIVPLVLCWLVLVTLGAWLRRRAGRRETAGDADAPWPASGMDA